MAYFAILRRETPNVIPTIWVSQGTSWATPMGIPC